MIRNQTDRWFLWYPIAVICGISGYFSLPREPHILVFVVAGLLVVTGIWILRKQRSSFRLTIVCFLLLGVIAAKARTEFVDPKVLRATTPTIKISGTVKQLDIKGKQRARMVVRLEHAGGIKLGALPKIVRLSGKKPLEHLFDGDHISTRARLFPLPTPTRPRGYDFGRRLWFEGVGATGFYYGDIKKINRPESSKWNLPRDVQRLRYLISHRVEKALPGEAGGLAIALITGDRGRLSKNNRDILRKAGLAHILAISGLHMSLVAGGFFWLVRALLALSGPLVLNFPIKKWAAIAGLVAGVFYLTISGGSIATQRAFIMLSIMFFAILMDRPAISMRNLAIAALVVALSRPEAVLSPGFQMSFMAVAGLIGFYELARNWRAKARLITARRGIVVRQIGRGGGFVLALATTTLIASVFTALPAVFHFNRIALFALAGNLIALPIVSFVVMPGAILTVLLMPLGLEFAGTYVMAFGLDIVMSHAQYVASLPNAQLAVSDVQTFPAFLLAGALIWACLWRGWLKAIAILPLVSGAILVGNLQHPDILISKFGRNVALRDQAGQLVFADSRKSRFAAENWLVSNGENKSLSRAATRAGWQCVSKICTAEVSGLKVAYLKKFAKPTADICVELSVIISAEPLGSLCKSVKTRIDRFDLWRAGAHAIYLTNPPSLFLQRADLPYIETSSSYRGLRPWVIKPIARRKILINPQQYRQYKTKPPRPRENQRAAALMTNQYWRNNPASVP